MMQFPQPDPVRAHLYHRESNQWWDETIPQLFGRAAEALPDKVAVRDASGASLSYAALDSQSYRVAGFLASRGISKGGIVTVCLPNWWQTVVAFLAVMKMADTWRDRRAGCPPVSGLLAAAQVDRLGRARSNDGRFIVGSGGANDLAAGGASCLVVMPLKEGRFVETLPFTTTRIRRLTGVATDLCLLERGENGSLRIAGVMCGAGAEHDALAEIWRRCHRDLSVVPDFTRFDPPSENELASLRRFDAGRAILA